MIRKPLTDAQVSTLITRVMDGNARGMVTLAYGRVSTKKQTEGISLRGQRGRIQRWADERGIIIPHDGWYEEPGDSAWKGKRPVFQKLLADLPHWADQGVQLVLVYQLDRFARNVHYALDVLKQLRSYGVIVVAVNGMVDYTTPSGWKSLMDQLVAAESYSRNLSQVMKDTRLSEAEEGRPIGPVPTGYARSDSGPVLDHRADQQRLLFRLFASGEHSATSLFVVMNGLGYRAWSEQHQCEVFYSKWNILEMLRNPFYIGKVRINGLVHDGSHQPLIDMEIWTRVQAILDQRGMKRGSTTVVRGGGVLSGVLRCASCDRLLWQHHKRGEATYVCAGRFSKQCQAVSLRESRLLPSFIDLLKRLAVPPAWYDSIIQKAQRRLEHHIPVVATPQPSDHTKQALARLKRLYIQGDYNDEDYEREKAALLAIDNVPSIPRSEEAVNVVEALQWLGDLPMLFQGGSLGAQRQLVRSLFAALWVDHQKGLVAIRPRDPYLDLVATVISPGSLVSRVGIGFPKLPTIPVWTAYNIPYRRPIARI